MLKVFKPLTYICIALSLCLGLNTAQASKGSFKPTEQGFNKWLVDFKKQARKQGISQATLNRAFKDVTLNRSVLQSDATQPEFTKTFFDYFNKAVSQYRVKNGQKFYKKHRRLLDQVTKKYGVPGRFIVAFWGMETNYGSYTGNIPIIESLATLAYDPRRSTFFTQQLLSALTILDRGHISLSQMKGSWAGAMGQSQFMPSNYLEYAVDGDGDGKINLWDSLPDVFYSSANFLSHLGWQKEENWGREVRLPKNFNFALADNRTQRDLNAWRKLGITLADSRPLPSSDLKARLLLMTDYKGPAFLVYENFKVIKRWNNSNKYAVAVGHLADRIVNRPALTKKQPANDKSLSRTQMIELQSKLNELNFATGKPDGIAGTKTRKAIRAYQVKHQLPADGFPSKRMYLHIQKVHKKRF